MNNHNPQKSFDNLKRLDANTYELKVRIAAPMLDELLDRWSEPYQHRLIPTTDGTELVATFRAISRGDNE